MTRTWLGETKSSQFISQFIISLDRKQTDLLHFSLVFHNLWFFWGSGAKLLGLMSAENVGKLRLFFYPSNEDKDGTYL